MAQSCISVSNFYQCKWPIVIYLPYFCSWRSHGTKTAMLESKLCIGTSKTKQLNLNYLCFRCPSGQVAPQYGGFCTMRSPATNGPFCLFVCLLRAMNTWCFNHLKISSSDKLHASKVSRHTEFNCSARTFFIVWTTQGTSCQMSKELPSAIESIYRRFSPWIQNNDSCRLIL